MEARTACRPLQEAPGTLEHATFRPPQTMAAALGLDAAEGIPLKPADPPSTIAPVCTQSLQGARPGAHSGYAELMLKGVFSHTVDVSHPLENAFSMDERMFTDCSFPDLMHSHSLPAELSMVPSQPATCASEQLQVSSVEAEILYLVGHA